MPGARPAAEPPAIPADEPASAPWSPAWIAGHLDAVLDMADAALAAGGWDVEKRLKLVSETALLLRLVIGGARSPGLVRRARRQALALAAEARSSRVLAMAAARPSAAAELAAAHAALSDVGLRDEPFGARIAELLADPSSWGVERTPWKELEQEWLRARLEASPAVDGDGAGGRPLAAAELALPLTSWARGLDVLASERRELYAFTHALLYATSFGERPAPPPRPVAAILEDAEAAIARSLADRDHDLAAELLLAFPYTRTPWSPAALVALERMRLAVQGSGILPPLGFSAEAHAAMAPRAGDAYLIRESYHTQYVWGFLLASMSLPGVGAPGGSPPGDAVAAMDRDGALWVAVRDDALADAARLLIERPVPDTPLSRRIVALLGRLARSVPSIT